ncbi:MAG: exodeoxyribonuclease VII large subunit, partial [Eggerthellaceae bacterium]|nr:exodeoxyribonuclease VII large subunit [Eggerthellaceae bacterium]
PVEGLKASRYIIEGLQVAQTSGAEVILLVRGGGSYQDLMPFNDEALARVIAASNVPIVTGIGHEPDTTIADLVSDKRASTPTAAAETVSPDAKDIRETLMRALFRANQLIDNAFSVARAKIDKFSLSSMFKDPSRLYANEAHQLNFMHDRLARVLPHNLETNMQRMQRSKDKFVWLSKSFLKPYAQSLSMGASRLNDLSPLNTLARGYAITSDEEGRILNNAMGLSRGDKLNIRYHDGSAFCVVESVDLNAR